MLTEKDLDDLEEDEYNERICIRIEDAHVTPAEAKRLTLERIEKKRELFR